MSAAGTPIPDRRQVDQYLAALFRDAETGLLVEVRWRSGRRMHRAFFGVAERDAAALAITQRAAQTDVCVGVLPRRRRGGGRADLADHGSVIWADCDTAIAAAALLRYCPPPSIAVASGTGENCHGYWLLSEPVGVADIELANQVLAASLSADPACAEPARVSGRHRGTTSISRRRRCVWCVVTRTRGTRSATWSRCQTVPPSIR